MMRQCRCAGKQ